MKTTLRNITLCLCLSVATGCANFTALGPTTTVAQAHAITNDAKKLAIAAGGTMEEFLLQEKTFNSSGLIKAKLPAVHQAAEYLRVRVDYAPPCITTPCPEIKTRSIPRDIALSLTLADAIAVFQANETQTGAANLVTAYNTLLFIYQQSQTNLLTIKKLAK